LQELNRPAPERLIALAQRDQPLHPPEQRLRIGLLRLNVDRAVVILRVGDDREIQTLRVGGRETGVAVATPLHRCADAVAVAQEDVIAHTDFVAVVNDWSARHREEQTIHQLNPAAIVVHQR
jgi:hypothetical protein